MYAAMIRWLLLFLTLTVSCTPRPAWAGEVDVERTVNAIYQAEGGAKATYPFGIRSVSCQGYAHCRRIARNTVINNWRRWQAAGQPGDYLTFLGNRYCPQNGALDDGRCKHWEPNVRYFLTREP